MSDSMSVEQHTPGEELAELEETVDGVPVLADVRTVAPATPACCRRRRRSRSPRPASSPAPRRWRCSAATVPASSSSAPPAGRLAAAASAFEIVASRRFMVDIHLFDKPSR